MPIYEYRCEACGFQNEYLQRVSDPLLTDCPECRKPTLTKLVSAAGFQLKGNGWYATDFRNNGAKPAADAKKSGEADKKSETEKSAETKKEDKPAEACGAGACPSCA